jgi:hypothetical protein
MRFDILDEYSTLVPFGIGIFEQNRVLNCPATATKAAKARAIGNCGSKFVKALARMCRVRITHAVTHAPPEIS